MENDDFTNEPNNSDFELFFYQKRNINDVIIKNSKTHLYECFDNKGNVSYKLVLLRKDGNNCYFKLVNEDYIIKYDIDTKILDKIKINDYYCEDDSNAIQFDKKTIIF